MLREAAACVDESLHVYRTSTTAWETASSYFRPAENPRPQSNEISDPGIRHHSTQPLPPTFISQYSNVRYKSFMGLFPQINRAWLSVDSTLFLWAYTPLGQTTPASDLFVYEGLSQIIVSVALVKPRKGVFVDSVRYLIAVATTVEVTLLGITFSPTGQLNIVPTQISIPTDNIIILKILSADDGRLFMAGADGGLHQFAYAPTQSSSVLDLFSNRPRKRARKIAHSSSIASYLLPTALKSWFSSQNELVDLAIEKNSLFTLAQSGILTVYNISDNQIRMITTSNISADAKHLFNFSVSPSHREFISIHPVTAAASSSVQLIVVTSLGERVYFSTRTSSVASHLHVNTIPTTLRCIAYRPSPATDMTRSSKPCVHISWCHRGAAILADLKDMQSDRLMCVYPDVNMPSSASSPSSSGRDSAISARTGEVVINVNLDDGSGTSAYPYQAQGMYTPMTPRTPNIPGGNDFSSASAAPNRTFAIAEAVFPGSENEDGMEGSDGQLQGGGVSMPMDPPYYFWVLTSTAIHLYERVNAMDRLLDLLSKHSGNSDEVKKFFDRYGVADACAMCIEIAISHPSLARVAANIFYTSGGSFGWNRNGSGGGGRHHQGRRSFSSMHRRRIGGAVNIPDNSFRFDVGRAAVDAAPMARFSGAHDGITLYLAKVLHPIWNNFITTDRDANSYQKLTDSKETLTFVRDQLLAVSAFLERYSPDDLLPKVRNEEDEGMDQRVRGGQHQHNNTSIDRRQRPSQDRRLYGSGFGGGSDQIDGMEDRIVNGLYVLKRTDEARELESNAIKGLVKLAIRAAEALALMLIVNDHEIQRLTVMMGEIGRQKIAEARWHDMIANDEDGKIVASSLIEAMFSLYDDVGAAMSSVGGILLERCPNFFGNVDEELHRGLASLRHAGAMYNECGLGLSEQAGIDEIRASVGWSAAMNKADEAVVVLKRVAGSIFDMRSVFDEFKRMGAIAGLLDIGLAIGSEAEENRKEERAADAFDEVLNVVDELMKERNENDNNTTNMIGMAENGWVHDEGIRDASMRLMLNCKSERFLLRLYELLTNSRRGQEMLTKEWSPSVEKFLVESESWESVWKYYAQHGRHYEAARVLFQLAETEKKGLVDRLNYLSCALLNAKTATSKGDERANIVLVELTDFLDVAKVQVRIRDELESTGVSGSTWRAEQQKQMNNDENDDNDMDVDIEKDKEEVKNAIQKLDEDILDLSLLFNKFARRFDLWECCLECLRCGSYRDDKYARQLWRDIVKRETSKTESKRLVAQNLEVIGRQFYPSEVVLPIGYLIELLEMVNFQMYGGEDIEWGVKVIRGIGVPLTDLVECYRKVLEKGQGQGRGHGYGHGGEEEWEWEWERCWVEERGQLHLVQVMEKVLTCWVDELVTEGNVMGLGGRGKLVGEGEKAMTVRVSELGKARLRGMNRGGNDMMTALAKRFELLEQRMSMLLNE